MAINTLALWTEFKMADSVLLGRFGMAPLDVKLCFDAEEGVDVGLLEAVAPHVHRFRQFTFSLLIHSNTQISTSSREIRGLLRWGDDQ